MCVFLYVLAEVRDGVVLVRGWFVVAGFGFVDGGVCFVHPFRDVWWGCGGGFGAGVEARLELVSGDGAVY